MRQVKPAPFPEGATVRTPDDINRDRTGSGVEESEDMKGSERMPRKGNELDKPESDRLGD